MSLSLIVNNALSPSFNWQKQFSNVRFNIKTENKIEIEMR